MREGGNLNVEKTGNGEQDGGYGMTPEKPVLPIRHILNDAGYQGTAGTKSIITKNS